MTEHQARTGTSEGDDHVGQPERYTVRGLVNPLAFLKLDEPWCHIVAGPLGITDILEYAAGGISGIEPASFVERYRQVSVESPRVCVAPAEGRILRRIILPLRYAKASYMLGSPLATVALCGLVAEMLAVLLWEAWRPDIPVAGRRLAEKDWKRIFGREFEQLGQERRVKLLRFFGVINDTQEQSFDRIRTLRNTYLHAFSKDESSLDADAISVFCATAGLVAQFFAQLGPQGTVIMAPQIIRYLRDRGIVSSTEDPPTNPEQQVSQSPEPETNQNA